MESSFLSRGFNHFIEKKYIFTLCLSIEVECNSVKCARGAHLGSLSKTVPKGAGSHANSGKNWQRRLLTNMGWTLECLSQAGKLVRGID